MDVVEFEKEKDSGLTEEELKDLAHLQEQIWRSIRLLSANMEESISKNPEVLKAFMSGCSSIQGISLPEAFKKKTNEIINILKALNEALCEEKKKGSKRGYSFFG